VIAPVIACGQHTPSPVAPPVPLPKTAAPADDHGQLAWLWSAYNDLLGWAGQEVTVRDQTNILRKNTATCLDKLEQTGQIRQTN